MPRSQFQDDIIAARGILDGGFVVVTWKIYINTTTTIETTTITTKTTIIASIVSAASITIRLPEIWLSISTYKI